MKLPTLLSVGGNLYDITPGYQLFAVTSRSRAATVSNSSYLGISAQAESSTFEHVGGLVGMWFGLSVGLATMPVVALDGPLPLLDVAWLFATTRITLKAMKIGSTIGAGIDDLLD